VGFIPVLRFFVSKEETAPLARSRNGAGNDRRIRHPGMRLLVIWMLALSAAAPASERDTRVSSGFGVRADPLHGRRTAHRGIDLPGRSGTPIVAAAGGVVRVAGRRGGYGLMVELVHTGGGATRYAHLSRIDVRPGDAVTQGQRIGAMGSTGRSTGSHLHFEYRLAGVAVDPRRHIGTVAATPIRTVRQAVPTEAKRPPHRSRFAAMRALAPPPAAASLPDGLEAAR
jgi:murein DD-endopeptidase MepM/ murein hydrolase activator NlpD